VDGLTVLVQGVGGVGGKLVELLAGADAAVIVSDVDAERARDAAADARGSVVPADRATETECDVYAPCALGGTLNERTISRLRCRVVAGAANNQLATEKDADRLASRGIVYAPDFVINAGGALHGVGIELLAWDDKRLARQLERIGDTLLDVYDRAERDGTSTDAAARQLAEERLSAASSAP
jgi:leucine dehydrogenase